MPFFVDPHARKNKELRGSHDHVFVMAIATKAINGSGRPLHTKDPDRMRAVFTSTIIFLFVALLPAEGVPQHASQDVKQTVTDACSQPAKEQAALIREAEAKQSSTRRVEFSGNNYTRDKILRRELVKGLNEGDLFTRRGLLRSLRNVSRLKVIHPVSQRDVVVKLERDGKQVDLLICFQERRR